MRGLVVASAVPALVAAAISAPAGAASLGRDGATAAPTANRSDNRPGPRTEHRNALRKAAIAKVVAGEAEPDADGVVQLGESKFAEITTDKTDRIFTVLAEFGTDGSKKLGATPGPLHNAIPAPDRSKDNSSYWVEDFDVAHYERLFNSDDPADESMTHYYASLSNGRYTVVNDVSDWVTVPHNGSYYGDNSVEDYGGAWQFVADAVDAWYQAQLDAGRPKTDVDAQLRGLDVWDRDDFDGDGDFDEADGYIDHFQAVHAGRGEEDGGGALGDDAIWSHRWYAFPNLYDQAGPTVDGRANKAGGTEIGESGIWVGDYTTEPENGGVGVFAHEFGHDLGLPDYYDTSGGENSTAFWTLMSSGSWLGHGSVDGNGIGTTPGLMGPEEKLFLGWLDYEQVDAGESGTFVLGPSQLAATDAETQAVMVTLPDKETSTTYTTTPSGGEAWWTGSADDLNESLVAAVPAASRVTVTAKAWYEIEQAYDYLYGEYSLDGGGTWTQAGAVSGDSGGRWKTLRFSYPAGGGESLFRFRYQTDGGVHEAGAWLDDVVVKQGGTVLASGLDGFAVPEEEATSSLWQRNDGTVDRVDERYYLAENRAWAGYDTTLRDGPYQFSSPYTAPDRVEFFSFRPGLLVWYVDHSYDDNNVAEHPGAGAAMVVDARPAPFTYPDGTKPSNRRQPFDATFGTLPVPETCLHKEVLVKKVPTSVAACAPAYGGTATFDDSLTTRYWDETNPQGSVKVAGAGVTMSVTGQDPEGNLTVDVAHPGS